MTTRVRFLGAAGFEITAPGSRILIDPFLTRNPVAPLRPDELQAPDVILVSHAAYDHLGDTAAIAIRTGAPVLCGADARALLIDQGVPPDQVRATIWGIVVRVGGVTVRPVESHHWSSATLSDGRVITGTPLGFIVETEPDVRVYHFGDTAIFGDMRLIGQLYRPTVGLIGCTHPKGLATPVIAGPGELLTGEMSPAEAAMAVELLDVRIAIATHYLDERDPEVTEFLARVHEANVAGYRTALAPAPGQVVVVDGATAFLEDGPQVSSGGSDAADTDAF